MRFRRRRGSYRRSFRGRGRRRSFRGRRGARRSSSGGRRLLRIGYRM